MKEYLQLVIEMWEGSKENFHLFFKALSSPRAVIELWDRDSSETVRRACVFSLLPVAIALFFDSAYVATYLPNSFTFTYFSGSFALYYLQMVVSSVLLFVVGWLFWGKASLKDCVTVSLVFMANLWPLNELVAYLMKTDKVLLCARVTGTLLSPSWAEIDPKYSSFNNIISLQIIFYILMVCTPAIKFIQQTGRLRAVVICILYMSSTSILTDLLFKPLWLKMFNACT